MSDEIERPSMPLAQMRLAAGKLQQDVADACGVARVSYLQWESGKCLPTVDKLLPLSAALNVKMSPLVLALVEGWRDYRRRNGGESA